MSGLNERLTSLAIIITTFCRRSMHLITTIALKCYRESKSEAVRKIADAPIVRRA
jgi:hypothetical protein